MRLSNITVQDGEPHGAAVELQNEVLANFQPVPPIWPQGARFCAANAGYVKGGAERVGGRMPPTGFEPVLPP